MSEIELYESALQDYRDELLTGSGNQMLSMGLCFYFQRRHFIGMHGGFAFMTQMPTLFSMLPGLGRYCFPRGELNPRIEILTQAIAAYKNNTNG